MSDSPNERQAGAEEAQLKLCTIPEMPDLLAEAGLKRLTEARIRQLAATPEFPGPVWERGNLRLFNWPPVLEYFRERKLRPGERTDLKRDQEAPPSDEHHDKAGPQ
ncbi:hypothetical protein [Streptomyces sp. NRRL S-350]|uniref:hypothetical protein n=1 Tax=Streptomyces sp. NRRL S-350 TaxID=1463902 RepID=UPI0004BED7F6|nr:hypothetical protein [Streptomyces sp. NRRL S-350]